MALVTIGAVVHIPVYLRVVEIIGVAASMFMTVCALEDRVITTASVAGGALAVSVAMVD
jgi:hypothetical protein